MHICLVFLFCLLWRGDVGAKKNSTQIKTRVSSVVCDGAVLATNHFKLRKSNLVTQRKNPAKYAFKKTFDPKLSYKFNRVVYSI